MQRQRRLSQNRIKDLLSGSVEGLPIKTGEIGMRANPEATEAEILEGIARVLGAGTEMTVTARFCAGDLLNHLTNRFEMKPKDIAMVLGHKQYNLLRQYAWISGKWPESRRDSTRPWSFYRDNTPGRPPTKRITAEERQEQIERAAFYAGYNRSYEGDPAEAYEKWKQERKDIVTTEQKPFEYAHAAGYGAGMVQEGEG